MTDDTTDALNRIANALELGALIEAQKNYKDDTQRYVSMSKLEDEGSTQRAELMGYADANHRRATQVQDRIDQLTGYQETK